MPGPAPRRRRRTPALPVLRRVLAGALVALVAVLGVVTCVPAATAEVPPVGVATSSAEAVDDAAAVETPAPSAVDHPQDDPDDVVAETGADHPVERVSSGFLLAAVALVRLAPTSLPTPD